MAMLPTNTQTVRVPAQLDLIALSKTIVIEAAFLVSVAAPIFGHVSADVLSYCGAVAITTGATLGVLRVSDIISNVLNVRAFLGSPVAMAAGVVPQGANTPLSITPPSGASNGGSAPGTAGDSTSI